MAEAQDGVLANTIASSGCASYPRNLRQSAACYFLLDFFFPPFFFPPFFLPPFFFGTLPPALRASDNPIAIACFLLVTFLPERPLFSFPFFRSCIARLTFFCAVLPYFAIVPPFDHVDFLAVPFAYCSLLTAYCQRSLLTVHCLCGPRTPSLHRTCT